MLSAQLDIVSNGVRCPEIGLAASTASSIEGTWDKNPIYRKPQALCGMTMSSIESLGLSAFLGSAMV
jgi:hypothetical protein